MNTSFYASRIYRFKMIQVIRVVVTDSGQLSNGKLPCANHNV